MGSKHVQIEIDSEWDLLCKARLRIKGELFLDLRNSLLWELNFDLEFKIREGIRKHGA